MEALGIDWKLFIAQGINFILFAVIFARFFYRPFVNYMHSQQQEETERAKLLEELRNGKEDIAKEEKKIIDAAHKKASVILREAHDDAEQARLAIINEAEEEAHRIRSKAEEDAAAEKARILEEVRGHIVLTAESMTRNVLRNFLQKKHQDSMIQTIIDSLSSKPHGH